MSDFVPWSAAVDHRLGPIAAWLAENVPASHQALADADPRVFPPIARAKRLWRRAERDLQSWRVGVWEKTHKSAERAQKALAPPVEIQRSGLLGHPELQGRLFPGLLYAGQGGPMAQATEQAHDRYYAELPQMPGDLDSAAAIALARQPLHLVPGALERLRWALAQSTAPVWQGSGWFGPECPAVTGRALSAAAAHGVPVNPEILQSLGDTQPWVRATHYPDPVLASVLVAQGLRDQGRPHQAMERMLASAPVDSWSPLAVAKVASFGGERLSARRREQLLVALVRTQRWDGSWPPSPWYMVPGMHGGMRPFESAAYTTVCALRALEGLRPGPLPAAPQGAAQ